MVVVPVAIFAMVAGGLGGRNKEGGEKNCNGD